MYISLGFTEKRRELEERKGKEKRKEKEKKRKRKKHQMVKDRSRSITERSQPI